MSTAVVTEFVSRRYENAAGAVACLSYEPTREGQHVIRYYGPGDSLKWVFPNVVGARDKWQEEAGKLKAQGYRRVD